MADTMQFDLVSPERSLASLVVTEARVPGAEGDMTAMPGHSPVITTLRPGVVSVTADGTVTEFVVTNGFAEVTASGVSVIAEKAFARDAVDADALKSILEDARTAAETAPEEQKELADRFAADMATLVDELA